MRCRATTNKMAGAGPGTSTAAVLGLAGQGSGGSHAAGTGTQTRSVVCGNGGSVLALVGKGLWCCFVDICTNFLSCVAQGEVERPR